MRLLDKDPVTGLEQHFLYDELDDMVGVRIVENYEPILDFNKFLQSDDAYRKDGIKKSFWHVASIPQTVIYQWLTEGFDIFKAERKDIEDRLNRPENQWLRTTARRI